MKLLGKDISAARLMQEIQGRLAERGLGGAEEDSDRPEGVESRVDPLAFNLEAMAERSDPTRALPIETHRGGVGGRAVVLAKRAFRATCQMFINEALGRQQVFNGHVRDSYAQLSAEVKRLGARVAELEATKKPRVIKPAARAPAVKKGRAKKKK